MEEFYFKTTNSVLYIAGGFLGMDVLFKNFKGLGSKLLKINFIMVFKIGLSQLLLFLITEIIINL